MNVSSQTGVVGQIKAGVVRIVIEDDVVGIPEPAIAEGDVSRGDGEEESAEAEA